MEVFGLGLKIQEQGAATVEASIKRLGAELAKTALAVAGLGATMKKFVDSTSEAQFASAQLRAMLTATQGAAGQTAEGLEAQAAALQNTTTYGDDAIVRMQALLLTFHNIRGAVFTDAIPAITDMAAALEMDLSSAAFAVGKALNDPAEGLAALSRLGIRFTDDQQKVIESLVKSGQTAQAQTIILDELKTRYGGAAVAARDTLGGALKALSETFGNLFELSKKTTSGVVAGIESINRALTYLNDNVGKLRIGFDALLATLTAFAATSLGRMLATTTAGFAGMVETVGGLGAIATVVMDAFIALGAAITAFVAMIGGPFGIAVAAIVSFFQWLNRKLDEINDIYDQIDASEAAQMQRIRDYRARRAQEQQEENKQREEANRAATDAAKKARDAELKAEQDHNARIYAERQRAIFEAERQRQRALDRQRAEALRSRETDAEYIARVSGTTEITPLQIFAPGELEAQLAESIKMIEADVNSAGFQQRAQQIRWTALKNGLAVGLSEAVKNGLTAGLTAALQTGRIGELFKALGQTMVQQIASMMVNVALTYMRFAAMIQRIQEFLLLHPGTAILAAAAMLTLAHSLGGSTKGGENVGAGGASGYSTAVMPRMASAPTQLTFGGTSANAAASLTALQPMTFNIIGTNDPAAQRAIQEMVSKANRRGSV